MDSGVPPGVPGQFAAAGRIPLAVVVVDGDGLVSHWSSGARWLFGHSKDEAIGQPAGDLMPVAGALAEEERGVAHGGYDGYDDLGPELHARGPYPTAGRARISHPGRGRLDVLWWAYPLIGPGPGRHLVLAADAGLLSPGHGETDADFLRIAPGFAQHTEFAHPESAHPDAPAKWLPDILPNVGPADVDRIVAQVLELGCPVLEFSRHERVPVTPHRSVCRRAPGRLGPVESDPGAAQAGHGGRVRRGDDGPARQGYGPQGHGRGGPAGEKRGVAGEPRVPAGEGRGHAGEARVSAGEAWSHAGDGRGPAGVARGPAPRPEPDLAYAAVRERLEFLNDVSGRIGSSLDPARTIREVTGAAVPRFTDFAETHLRAAVLAGEGLPDGPPDATTIWHRVWVEHNDEPGAWDGTVPVGEALAFPEHTPFFQCVVTGEPVLIPRLGEEMGSRISGEFEKRDLRPLINHRSLLLVPLKARDAVLGCMVLMRRPDREPFDETDRGTGAELAAWAGLVLDNARMHTYQETVAETLQDMMLPQVAPRMAGCDIATRYLPGTRLGRIGGDWFDAVGLPGSRTALVVGDVMGHGLDSAAMMGQLRTAVRTMAAMEVPPAQLLRGLDDLARRLGERYLATCLYVVYDPIGSQIQIANAGHVPPVLVRAEDGRGEVLDLPTGAPIGVGGVAFETVTVRVKPGDRLVLCTDGLVEVRGEVTGDGLAALCASAAHPAASMDHACDTVIRALNTRGGRKDDVALLMARLNGVPDGDVAEYELTPDPSEVGRARRVVRDRLLGWGLPDAVETAELMVSELVTNALRHTRSRRIGLRLVRTEALLCEVTDGEPAPAALLDAGHDDERGRGLRVVSTLAREWGTSSTAQGKTVWFEQTLPRRVATRCRG